MEPIGVVIIGVVALVVMGWVITTAIKTAGRQSPPERTKIEAPVWTSTRGPVKEEEKK